MKNFRTVKSINSERQKLVDESYAMLVEFMNEQTEPLTAREICEKLGVPTDKDNSGVGSVAAMLQQCDGVYSVKKNGEPEEFVSVKDPNKRIVIQRPARAYYIKGGDDIRSNAFTKLMLANPMTYPDPFNRCY